MSQHIATARSYPSTIITFAGVMTIVLIVISFATAVAAQHYVAEQFLLINQTLYFGVGGILMGIIYICMLAVQRFRR